MKKNYFFITGMMLVSSVGFSQTRYLSATGADAGDCSLPGSPCATLNYAVSQANANDSVLVASGNYAFNATQTINKSVIVSAADVNNKPVITSTASDIVLVDAADVVINGLKINMGLTASTGLRGLVLDTENDGITITNNEIISTKTLSIGMVFDAYAIAAYGGNGTVVNISNNQIKPSSLLNDAFGRGLALGINALGNGAGGVVSDNLIQAYYPIQAVVTTEDLEIKDNTISGTAMIGYPAAGVTIGVKDNTFSGENDLIAGNLYALLEVRAANGATVNVEGNTFEKYVNIGLFSAASNGVSVVGNTFSPSATASNFASVHANSKLMSSAAQTTTHANDIAIKGNTFNAGLANNGAAIIYADHYGVTAPAFTNGIQVGGAAAADMNTFNNNLKYFIQLDNSTGNSNTIPLWNTYSVSVMKPFNQNVTAYTTWNTYPSNDTTALGAKIFDVNDAATVGRVILQEPMSINENEVANVVSYPNPTTDVLFIQSNGLNGNNIVKVIDVQGRVVMSSRIASQGTLSISVEGLNTGIYSLSIENNGKFYNNRFIKK